MEKNSLSKCTLCPRDCHSNRYSSEGRCHMSWQMKAGRAGLHYFEEPCISGTRGSGAIFFAGCPLGCIYCQNYKLAKGEEGVALTIRRLEEIFWELKEQGAANINLVTATSFVPQIVTAIANVKKDGFLLPFIYNSSGYEKVDTLKQLDGLIDVYLPDYKYEDSALATVFSKAPDYPSVAKRALQEMYRQVGSPRLDKDGYIEKGMMVRHLILPGHTKNSMAALTYLFQTYKNTIFLSLLGQYTPVGEPKKEKELNRTLTKREYQKVLSFALSLGFEKGYFQEGETAKESFIPSFLGEGIEKP